MESHLSQPVIKEVGWRCNQVPKLQGPQDFNKDYQIQVIYEFVVAGTDVCRSKGDPSLRKGKVSAKCLVHPDTPRKITALLFKIWKRKLDWSPGQYQGGQRDMQGRLVDRHWTIYGHELKDQDVDSPASSVPWRLETLW